jgi:hypothetical protein
MITNSDGTVSFEDVTVYTNKDNSYFGAKDANAINTEINTLNNCLRANNAGAHNSVYRGASLGTSVTSEQYAAISSGSFDDMYIGDYWTINDVNWRIAAFDYFYNTGDTRCLTHHAVVVPDKPLYWARMNATASTSGGYVGSEMYTTNLANAKSTIKSAFSGHVMKHRLFLVKSMAEGRPNGINYYDSEVTLLNEHMVYGGAIFQAQPDGSETIPTNHRIEKTQLPLFLFDPTKINIGSHWWLRDCIAETRFASVSNDGYANRGDANSELGVRPFFSLC